MKQVLIVDDHKDLRDLVEVALSNARINTSHAGDCQQAMDALETNPPDLVILDIIIPGEMDGLAICRHIKTNPDLAQTKVILLSAKVRTDFADRENVDLADLYFSKPFSPLALRKAVVELLAA